MVEVRLAMGGEDDNFVIIMEEGSAISSLKTRLSEEYSFPVHCQQLTHAGLLVEDDTSLDTLKQPDSSVILLRLNVRYVLKVDVYTGHSFEMEVSSNEPVNTVVSAVSRRARVPYYRQDMVYDGAVLELGKKISDYGIPDRAVLVVNLRNYETTVFIKTLDGKTIVLNVSAYDTVDQVKEKIEQQENIPASKQRLIFVGEQLRSDHRFLDYRIEHESAVHLVLRERASYEVYADTPSGKCFVVEIDPTDTLDKLKEKLRSKEDIPCHLQRIYHGDYLLPSDRTLSESGVLPKSTLRLAIEEGYAKLIITLPSQNTFSLWVRLDQTVMSLKEAITEREQHLLRERIELHYAHSPLDSQRTLRAVGLRHNQNVHVSIPRPPVVRLSVNVRGGNLNKQVQMQRPMDCNVLSIKHYLTNVVDASIEEQQLFFEGVVLQNKQTLSDCGVKDHSTLDLIVSPSHTSGQVRSVHLFVRTLTGKVIGVDVSPTDTVLAIKEQVRDKEQVPVSHQCLVIGGRILEDSVTLSDCSVQNQSVLHLVLRVPSQGPVRVTIQGTNTSFQLSVLQGDTVNLLKEQIEGRANLPATRMKLQVNGVLLNDASPLADYNLEEDAVIQVEELI